MRALVVATNATPTGLENEVKAQQHPRVDYMELADRLETKYMDYNDVPVNRPLRWMENTLRLDIRQAVQVATAVQEQHYEVVISLSERVGIPLTQLLDRSVRHVVIMHHPLSAIKLRLLQALDSYHRWSTIIAISRAEAEALRQRLDLGAEHVKAMQTPVDTGFFQPGKATCEPTEQDHIESLGLSYRDYPTLIRAMRLLPDITCYLRAGSSWVSHKAGYESEEIPHNIHLKPIVHPSLLRSCYASSRFIVVPICQTTQWSAGCTTVQQAQAMGKAVICTAIPGLSDYVLDGETGILVEAGNHVALAEAIADLWNHPEKAAAMGRRGRELTETEFSLDKWLSRLVRIVEEQMTTWPSAAGEAGLGH